MSLLRNFFLAFLFVLGASASGACPDLRGSFECRKTTGNPYILEITQVTANDDGVTSYNFDHRGEFGNEVLVVIADGQEKSYEGGNKSRSECLEGQVLQHYANFGTHAMNAIYSLNEEGHLVVDIGGVIFSGEDRTPVPQDSTQISCTRLDG